MSSRESSSPGVRITLGQPFAASADPAEVLVELRSRLIQGIGGICERLGFGPAPPVEIGTSDQDEPVRIEIDGLRIGFGERVLERAADYFALPRDVGSRQPSAWPAILGCFVASHGQPEHGPAEGIDLLAELILSVIDNRADALFGPRQAAPFVAALAARHTGRADVDGGSLLPILRTALRLHTPFHEVDAVSIVLEGLEHGESAQDIAETLIADLRPRALTIAANQAYLRAMFGAAYADPPPGGSERIPRTLADAFDLMADGIFYELGVRQPKFTLVGREEVRDQCFWVELGRGAAARYRGLAPDQILVNASPEELEQRGVKARAWRNPVNRRLCALTSRNFAGRAAEEGMISWDPGQYMALATARELRQNAWRLVDRDAVEFELGQLMQAFPDLVHAVMSRMSSRHLTRILRGLVREEISIRDLRIILESLLPEDLLNEHHRPELRQDAQHYVEVARSEHKAYVSHKYTRGKNQLAAYLLDPDLEGELLLLAAGGEQDPAAGSLAERSDAVRRAVGATIETSLSDPFVILTTIEVRRYLRELLEADYREVAVLSYQELSPDVNIKPIGRIGLAIDAASTEKLPNSDNVG